MLVAAAVIKPRLLGHWGTSPGLNFIYVHLNRAIKARGLDLIYICGPGHGGRSMVANTWLEGTYSEIYPNVSQNKDGMRHLFKQFSFPGGIPSHAAPETPGSIHEGDDPMLMHQQMAATLDTVLSEIAGIQKATRSGNPVVCRQWPMIISRSPKGWTGPKIVD